MPCPLFQPTSPLAGFAPDAAPLGDLYGGQCSEAPGTLIPIDTLRQYCNFGYARKVCDRAAHVETDAVRFVIQSHSNGTVQVAWSTESNHHPAAVGTVAIAPADAATGDLLNRQARAYVSSYLRRTGKT